MAPSAPSSAHVTRTTHSSVILGQESAFANRDTLVVIAIASVLSCITGLGAAIFARVKILRTVTMSMARASAVQDGLVTRAVSLVQRVDTGLGVNRSANVKMELHVILPMENVIVLLDGLVCSYNQKSFSITTCSCLWSLL